MSSFESGIVRRVQPVEVFGGLVDLLWMNRSELSVRPGIAEVKRELSGLRLHLGMASGAGGVK